MNTPGNVSRRGLMGAAAALGMAGATLPGAASSGANPLAVDAATLWGWNRRLAAGGPRLTGNKAHREFVDWLGDKLGDTGLRVRRDRLTFDRWVPRKWGLRVDGEPVDVAFYFPYSGVTPPQGVSGQLMYLGVSPLSSLAWARARGKIAVVDVPSPSLPVAVAFPPIGRYPSDAKVPGLVAAPGITDVAAAPLLELAREAGVLGVICIRTGVSDDLAKDQYSPFTTGYQGCPALWLGPTAGKRVRAKARRGDRATLTLYAKIERRAATDTIWAVLPGTHPTEAVVVNTHTDGPNVAEENGGLGLLALAHEFGTMPRRRRRRSLIFVATTGHFQIPQLSTGELLAQSASRWIADHPELVNGRVKKVVAALTIEHLGCREWADHPATNTYTATGANDPGFCYTSTPAMRRTYLGSARGTANRRTFAVLPPPALYFGEGHDFYKKRIATMSLIPAPTYLVATPADGALGKLDRNLMHGQVRTFANAIRALDGLTAQEIGRPLGV